MPYLFNGFFAQADQVVLQSALTQWPYCVGRIIDRPVKRHPIDSVPTERHSFVGIGVRWPEQVDIFDDPKLRPDLLVWSSVFPAVTFVWIDVECWGGVCTHGGIVFQNGMIVATEPITEGNETLVRLVDYLGIKLGATPYFEPFTRDYFTIGNHQN